MAAIGATTTLTGLIGWPVSHSLSPRMHNAAFAAVGLDWAYVPLPVEPERVGEAVLGLRALGFAGANVTIPHKTAVIEHLDEVDDFAREAESVNTIVVRDGRLRGLSTDGLAVVSAVRAEGVETLVLGAGGAAKAVAAALRAAGAQVRMTSRRDTGWLEGVHEVDLLVNATPVKDSLLVQPLPHQQVVDLAYVPDGGQTALVAAAHEAGCPVIVDGLEVLLRQGAASFEQWTGVRAPMGAMRAALRN